MFALGRLLHVHTDQIGSKLYGLVDKLGPPVNKLSNKLGSEAFWPTTLDKESDKAARILRSFCSKLCACTRSQLALIELQRTASTRMKSIRQQMARPPGKES